MPSHSHSLPSNSDGLLAFLQQAGKMKTLATDEVLFREKEPCAGVYFVAEGSLELTLDSGTRRMHLGCAHPGELVNISCVLAGAPNQCTATAMVLTKVIFVDSAKIREYLQTHSEICLNAVQLLGSEIIDLNNNAIRPLRTQSRYKPN